MRKSMLLLVLAVLGFALTAAAQDEYVIGPEDVLEIAFWQDPQLDAEVRVGQNGMISVDVIGEIEAAGRTTLELQDDIVRRMSRLNKRISQAVVRVAAYNYQHVFVSGEVTTPGKYAFERIPDLLAVINEAGWVTQDGDLTRVTIIRGGERTGQVETVDLAAALSGRSDSEVPVLYRTDAIEIPAVAAGLPPANLGEQAEQRNVIYVTGAVNTPGTIRFEANLDVYEALALAGGPADNANLKKVRVVTKDGRYGQSVRLDLTRYSLSGAPARLILSPEDHVVVPPRRGNIFGSTLTTTATLLGIATSAVLLSENL